MNDQLHIFICEHFKKETHEVLSSGEFKDVITSFFPSRCSRPVLVHNQLYSLPELNSASKNDKTFCGCSCLTAMDKEFLTHQNIRYISLVNCFQMLAAKELINSLISEGSYLVTPGWLSEWKEWLIQWGGQVQARQIFSESVTKIVLLDTGINPKSITNLNDLSEALDCPVETINVGLDFYRLFLENEILKWRVGKTAKKINEPADKEEKSKSDYAMALDLLSELPRAEKEEVVANLIMEVFVMLFAPGKVHYLSIIDSKPVNFWSLPPTSDPEPIKKRLSEFNKPISLAKSGKGFCLKIGKGNETLAIIEVDDLLISEHLPRYQNLSLSMAGVFALCIINSRYYQKILEINKQLQESNNTKDKFFNIIAHDLKSPFASILGFSEMLSQNYKTLQNDKIELFAKAIYDSSAQAYDLLGNLLMWAQSQKGSLSFSPEIFNFNIILRENINLLEQMAFKKNIILSSTINAEIQVFADINMMNTIMRNLLSNAIKFTPIGGKIIIGAISSPDFIELTITDTGIGIPGKILNELFSINSNITTEGTEHEKGTGLGLTLCREFIEKHGGKIWADSKINVGSTFHFTIPKKYQLI